MESNFHFLFENLFEFSLDECSNNQQLMPPVRGFGTAMENEPSDSRQDVDNSPTPQMHEQLTVHSRHHSPLVADLTNDELFLSGPDEFRQT